MKVWFVLVFLSASTFGSSSDLSLKISTKEKTILVVPAKISVHLTLTNKSKQPHQIPAKGTCRFFSMFDILFNSATILASESNPCKKEKRSVILAPNEKYEADLVVDFPRTDSDQGARKSELRLFLKEGIRDLPEEKRKNIFNYKPYPILSNSLDLVFATDAAQRAGLEQLHTELAGLNHCETDQDCLDSKTRVLWCEETCCGCGYLVHKSENAKFKKLQASAQKISKHSSCPCYEHCGGECRISCSQGSCVGTVPPAVPVY